MSKSLETARPLAEPDEIFLVDASGFIFRAYHALPPLTKSDGTPVGAVLGFVNILTRLIDDMQVKHVGVIFDAARKNFRNEIYDAYKTNRSDTPEDLIPQFPLIRAATEAFSLLPIEVEGFEADDLIATYARLANDAGHKVTIVSSDKDLMQLVRDGVRMYDPMKFKFMGEDDVVEKFGVRPDKVVDVQALAGDAIDNVPGVPGIGIKTAAQLINEYGSLESLLERAGEIKQPKRRETLVENADMARISKRLVRLDDNAPVPVALENLTMAQFDANRLLMFLQDMEFKSAVARMQRKTGVIAPPAHAVAKPVAQAAHTEAPPAVAFDASVYEMITTEDALSAWVARAIEKGICAIDTETTDLTPAKAELVGISLSTGAGNGCYIPLQHRTAGGLGFDGDAAPQLPIARVLDILKPMLVDPSVMKVGHNIKYDLQMFMRYGIDITPVDDTMLLSYVVDGMQHGHGMDELSGMFLGHTPVPYAEVAGTGKNQVTFDLVPVEKALEYAAEDAEVTYRLYDVFKPKLYADRMVNFYETVERPLAPVIAKMESHGVRVDVDGLRMLSQDFARQIMALEQDIHAEAGQSFNIGSPKQLGDVLFGSLGLTGATKTKTGAWSTSADVLEDLAVQGHGIVEKILEWRQLSKLKSTYADSLPQAISPRTGRIHTSFSMVGTNTGRLSSSDPNLQNIPIRTEQGKKIRAAFIPEDGWELLSADYSQVELRLAAAMADIKALKQAFVDGHDIHAATASHVMGIPLAEITPDLRRSAKAINFGIIYGISGFGLAKQLGITPGEAGAYIKQYLSRYPELANFMQAQKEYAREHGYVRTLDGRKVTIRGINDKNAAFRAGAERQAINAPLQGTAADIMKKAMISIHAALRDGKFKTRMLLQVHDELLFEVPPDEKETVCEVIVTLMKQAGEGVDVPLEVEAGFGSHWGAAH